MRFAFSIQLSSRIFFQPCLLKIPSFFLEFVVVVQSLCCIRLSWDPVDCNPPGPLSMEFSGQEYWSGLPFPSPGDLPDPGIKPMSSALAGGFFTTEPPGKSFSSNYLTPLWKISWPCNYVCQCFVCFFTISITHFLTKPGISGWVELHYRQISPEILQVSGGILVLSPLRSGMLSFIY